MILPEYRIDLLTKNRKVIKKIENFDRIEKRPENKHKYFFKSFKNKKFMKGKRFKKKFNYHKKSKKNNFNNTKVAI